MKSGKCLIDTNVVIAFLQGEQEVAKQLYLKEQIYIPVIVVGELLYGAYCSRNVDENIQKIQQFISNCILLNIDDLTAENYAIIKH